MLANQKMEKVCFKISYNFCDKSLVNSNLYFGSLIT